MEESETVSYYLLSGYHGLGETLTRLFVLHLADGAAEERKMLETALSTYSSFAMMYPTAKPMTLIWRGVYARLDGRIAAARSYMQRSLKQATLLDMPFALAITHREIARLEAAGTPEQRSHVERARQLFAQCGAIEDVKRLDAAAGG
jgi:hypothetical protein